MQPMISWTYLLLADNCLYPAELSLQWNMFNCSARGLELRWFPWMFLECSLNVRADLGFIEELKSSLFQHSCIWVASWHVACNETIQLRNLSCQSHSCNPFLSKKSATHAFSMGDEPSWSYSAVSASKSNVYLQRTKTHISVDNSLETRTL